MAYDTIAKEHNLKAEQLKQLLGIVGKIKWNGNRNILGDAIFKFMQTKTANDLPLLEVSPDVISSLVSLF